MNFYRFFKARYSGAIDTVSLVFVVLFMVFSSFSCFAESKHVPTTLDNVISLLMPSGHAITVEVADDNSSRMRGLMFRRTLPVNTGMIFVFPDEAMRGFYMKNTYVPLSIAFLDSSGTVVSISDMTPLSLRTILSQYPAQYAIEVNQGAFDTYEVVVGTQLTLPSTLTSTE